jgi:hypothetical protein
LVLVLPPISADQANSTRASPPKPDRVLSTQSAPFSAAPTQPLLPGHSPGALSTVALSLSSIAATADFWLFSTPEHFLHFSPFPSLLRLLHQQTGDRFSQRHRLPLSLIHRDPRPPLFLSPATSKSCALLAAHPAAASPNPLDTLLHHTALVPSNHGRRAAQKAGHRRRRCLRKDLLVDCFL